MNILSLGATHFVNALRKQGHAVVSVGYWEGCDIFIDYPMSALHIYERIMKEGFIPHAAIWDDNGNLPAFPDIEALPCPSIAYSIDTFCNPWHIPYSYAFDHVLVAQKDYVPLFPQQEIPCSWFPLFARHDHDICSQDFSSRTTPIVFVGTLDNKNLPERKPFLEKFNKIHPILIQQGDYVPLYNQSCIVLNATAASELNFRCFEAMACGCALLMEQCANGLDELFVEGENILPLYKRNNAQQAAIIARTSLAHPETLARIAQQGYEEVMQKHLDTHRAADIVNLLEKLISTKSHEKRLANLEHRKHFLSTAYVVLIDELNKNEFSEHVALYQKLFEHNLKKSN